MAAQYSWMREALEQDDERDANGERASEGLVADTIGGRTRTQIEEQQKTRQQQEELRQSHQHPSAFNRSRHETSNSPLIAPRPPHAETLNATADKQRRASSPMSAMSAGSGTSNVLRNYQQRIDSHPRLGDGGARLYNTVQRIRVVPEDRVPSSTREIEHQRAASSMKPPTPFFKETEPEVLLQDSPREQTEQQQHHGQEQRHLSVFEYDEEENGEDDGQFHHPPRAHAVIASHPHHRSTSTQTNNADFRAQPPQSQAAEQTRTRNGHFEGGRQNYYSRNFYDRRHSPFTTHRSSSLSDYPQSHSYDSPLPYIAFNERPLGPNHYKRKFIDSLRSDIRKVKDTARMLDKRREQLDEVCERDVRELNVIRCEREQLMRDLELELREQEHAELERRYATGGGGRNSLFHQPHPILKQSTTLPPHLPPTPPPSTRVNFANPISTAKEFTPNSTASSANGAMTRQPLHSSTFHSNRPAHQQGTHQQTSTNLNDGIAHAPHPPPPQTNQRHASTPAPRKKTSAIGGAHTARHRVVLANRTNANNGGATKHVNPFLPPSPMPPASPSPRRRSPSDSTAHARNVNVDRENESRRVAHEAEFYAIQQRTKAAAAAQRARGRVPVLRHAHNPVNPSSLFQFIPSTQQRSNHRIVNNA